MRVSLDEILIDYGAGGCSFSFEHAFEHAFKEGQVAVEADGEMQGRERSSAAENAGHFLRMGKGFEPGL